MVIWTNPAKDALKQIHDFIAQDSDFYAKKVIDDIIAGSIQIETFPKSGRVVPEKMDNNIREIFSYSYRIIYEIKDTGIYILNIIHGSRNYKDLLENK